LIFYYKYARIKNIYKYLVHLAFSQNGMQLKFAQYTNRAERLDGMLKNWLQKFWND